MSAFRRIPPSIRRHFSSSSAAAAILSPDSPNAVLTSSQKTRSALSLLKSETNPVRILDICRAASLTPDHHLDRIAFSVAVTNLSKANNFSSIREYIDELTSLRPDLRNERFVSHAIVLYGQANMINDAVELYKRVDELGVGRSVRSFNALLFACIVAKEYNEMKRVFLDFPRMYVVQPDLISYNTVIKGFGESGSVNSVWSILAEMDRKGIRPDATTFGNALSGFYKEEKLDDVGKLVNLMKEKYGVKQGVGVYNVRIQGLCKLGRSEEARALMDGMMERGIKPNTDTYRNLIHGFCKEEKYKEAKGLFKKMADRGCQPDSECYFNLVYYLCKGGQFRSALNFCKESMGKGWVPNFGTMKLLVMGLVGKNMVEEAKELTAQVKEKFPGKVGLWEEVEAAFPQ